MLDENGCEGPVHPAVIEWQRWRCGIPLTYENAGMMPFMISLGFDHLVAKFGREPDAMDTGVHDAAVQAADRRMKEMTGQPV